MTRAKVKMYLERFHTEICVGFWFHFSVLIFHVEMKAFTEVFSDDELDLGYWVFKRCCCLLEQGA